MYTHVRYICYQCPTIGISNSESISGHGISPGSISGDLPTLKGNVEKLSDDAKIRIQRFISVLEYAFQEMDELGSHGPTLKVFTAPEFYFRPKISGVAEKNVYTKEQFEAIYDVLQYTILGEAGAHSKYQNWLILAGTVIWKDGDKFKNTCISLYGGKWIKKEDGNFLDLNKAQPSTIDGVPTDSRTPHFKSDSDQLAHIQPVAGLNVGVEVCLEHALYSNDSSPISWGVLKNLGCTTKCSFCNLSGLLSNHVFYPAPLIS